MRARIWMSCLPRSERVSMEQYKVKVLAAARRDLDEILGYLNTLLPHAAVEYAEPFSRELESLAVMPLRCPLARDRFLAEKGYRCLVVKTILFSSWSRTAQSRSDAFCMDAEVICHFCNEFNKDTCSKANILSIPVGGMLAVCLPVSRSTVSCARAVSAPSWPLPQFF